MRLLKFNARRVLPSILQSEKSECGLACLAMVLSYFGHRIDINSLRARYAVSQQGLTLKSLIELAERVQLSARPVRLELDELAQLQLPAVLHWDLNHFVVLSKVTRKQLVIHDPAVGVRTYTPEAVSKHFTGVALELVPTSSFQAKKEESTLAVGDLWTKAIGLRQSITQILILSLLMQIFALALPFYSQIVIDDVLVRHDADLLLVLAIGFLAITIMNVATEYVRSFVVLHMSNSLGFQLATNINRHLLKLPLAYFGKRHLGDIVSRFGSIFKIKDFITSGIVEVFVDGLMVIGTFILIFVYSLKLSAVVVALLVVNTAVKFSLYSALRRENEELIAVSAAENTTFMENIRAIQGIKLFGKETDRNLVWQNVFAGVSNKGIQVQKLNIYIKICRGLIYGIENILIIFLAAKEVMAGALSIGMMMAFLSYKDQLYRRFFALVDKYFDYRIMGVHLARLADIVHMEPEPINSIVPVSKATENSDVLLELDNIAFRYSPQGPMIFQHVELRVSKQESVAIIGPTGCGKSSLAKVILSLYQPSSGSISLGGTTVSNMGLDQYRSEVSAVLQDDTLLSGSIFENISFFDPVPDRNRVEEAAAKAAIANDIDRLPMRYDTLVGNMGAALSGGQVQRLLLARAFYKRSKLLVLDEASSHLDLETEMLVNRSIREMKIARIIIAHRPQSFMLADTIYALTPHGLVHVDKQHFLNHNNVPINPSMAL